MAEEKKGMLRNMSDEPEQRLEDDVIPTGSVAEEIVLSSSDEEKEEHEVSKANEKVDVNKVKVIEEIILSSDDDMEDEEAQNATQEVGVNDEEVNMSSQEANGDQVNQPQNEANVTDNHGRFRPRPWHDSPFLDLQAEDIRFGHGAYLRKNQDLANNHNYKLGKDVVPSSLNPYTGNDERVMQMYAQQCRERDDRDDIYAKQLHAFFSERHRRNYRTNETLTDFVKRKKAERKAETDRQGNPPKRRMVDKDGIVRDGQVAGSSGTQGSSPEPLVTKPKPTPKTKKVAQSSETKQTSVTKIQKTSKWKRIKTPENTSSSSDSE